MSDFILNADNYYSVEANKIYCGSTQFKDFVGTYGQPACEYRALEIMNGRWKEEDTPARLVGSFVDAFWEGSLDRFKTEHPEIFIKRIIETPETASKLPSEYLTKNGTIKRDKLTEAKEKFPDAFDVQYELKADYRQAERIIERTLKDKKFCQYMSGEKQVIMTAEMFGTLWKIKIDSYHKDLCIVDLKVMRGIFDPFWVRDLGHLDFIRYWGYDIQGALYQKVVEINTGKKLPFYIAAVTKSDHPQIRIIQIPQEWLDEALNVVEANTPRIIQLKNGEVEPHRCEMCDCCNDSYVIDKPIMAYDLLSGF